MADTQAPVKTEAELKAEKALKETIQAALNEAKKSLQDPQNPKRSVDLSKPEHCALANRFKERNDILNHDFPKTTGDNQIYYKFMQNEIRKPNGPYNEVKNAFHRDLLKYAIVDRAAELCTDPAAKAALEAKALAIKEGPAITNYHNMLSGMENMAGINRNSVHPEVEKFYQDHFDVRIDRNIGEASIQAAVAEQKAKEAAAAAKEAPSKEAVAPEKKPVRNEVYHAATVKRNLTMQQQNKSAMRSARSFTPAFFGDQPLPEAKAGYPSQPTRASKFCIGYMAAQGHKIEDIFNPNKLKAEKEAIGTLYRQRAQLGDTQWFANNLMAGQIAMTKQANRFTDSLHIEDKDKPLDKLATASLLGATVSDLRRESMKPEVKDALSDGSVNKSMFDRITERSKNISSFFSGMNRAARAEERLFEGKSTDNAKDIATVMAFDYSREELNQRKKDSPNPLEDSPSFQRHVEREIQRSPAIQAMVANANTQDKYDQLADALLGGDMIRTHFNVTSHEVIEDGKRYLQIDVVPLTPKEIRERKAELRNERNAARKEAKDMEKAASKEAKANAKEEKAAEKQAKAPEKEEKNPKKQEKTSPKPKAPEHKKPNEPKAMGRSK